jgi:predicted DNA-binding protein (MmcQ/YjbR family)
MAEDRAMNHDELVAYCMAKPGAVPDEPWEGDIVAKVGGKIFAFLGGDGLGVKCGRDSDEAAELRHRYPEHVTVMAYIGRHGWNSVRVDGTIPDEELRELVDESYAAIVAKLPKRLRPQKA